MAVVILFFVALSVAMAAEGNPDQNEFFEKKVRPVLVERCYKCHSTQSEKLKGGLLLDSREGALKGGDDGRVLTPGAPDKSKLIEAVRYDNADLQMPPKGKLPDAEIATLVTWVKMGVPWPASEPVKSVSAGTPVFDLEKRRGEHWAWQPIQHQKPPAVQEKNWPLTAPDQFLLAKLEQASLRPSPAADRRTLIRRVYFDLTGLPPTPAQVDEFLQDQSPKAYDRVVDRLLASPHFGERWARHWLDLVRYAETLGHEFDYPIHNVWRYRDYVIRAFNADVPYDQFVMEHVAGDLLPNPRRNPTEDFNESVIGTAFFWLGQREHSPVDVRQHQAELIDNQIDVMCKTFLGLTVACARCHDHKFDAIATKDFYSLYGVLESSRYAQKTIDSAAVPVIEKLKLLKKEIRAAAVSEWSRQSSDVMKFLEAAAEKGRTPSTSEPKTNPHTNASIPTLIEMEHGLPLYPWTKLLGAPASREEFHKKWNLLLSQSDPKTPLNQTTNEQVFSKASADQFTGWFADGDAFALGAGGEGDFIIGASNATLIAEPTVNDAVISRQLEGWFRSPGFVIHQRYIHILAAGRESRIRICVDNLTMIRDPIYGGLMKGLDREKPGWLTFDVTMWPGHRAFIELSDSATPDPTEGPQKQGQKHLGWISASEVVFSDRASPPSKTDRPLWLHLLGSQPPDSLAALIDRYRIAFEQALQLWDSGKNSYSKTEQAQIEFLNWLLENRVLAWPGSVSQETKTSESNPLTRLVTRYHEMELSIPEPIHVPAITDGDGVDEKVFIRGNPKTLGELAPRKFLTALSKEAEGKFKLGSGRLELAHCMVDSSNPFLARVMVNRVWLHLFGRGIVPTPDDFGKLGQPPTHPELLDWLASWYRIDAHWSTKKLVRLLVTSRAYQMSSMPANAVAEEKDPENMLYHRMPIRRLEAEAIRDAMLAISGRLDDQMFGPSIPVHLTEFMDGRGRPGSSGPLDGAGRRSVYIEVRRNFLPPMMRTFDAPVPSSTIGKRTTSTVPAQSLILLNDPFVFGQAQAWAVRVLKNTNLSPQQRIELIYLMAFARVPTEQERTKAVAFFQQQAVEYGLDTTKCDNDEKLWTDFCHVAFNLKEFVYLQ